MARAIILVEFARVIERRDSFKLQARGHQTHGLHVLKDFLVNFLRHSILALAQTYVSVIALAHNLFVVR